MRNNQYGYIHNKKPYNRMQTNLTLAAAQDFARCREALIGNPLFYA